MCYSCRLHRKGGRRRHCGKLDPSCRRRFAFNAVWKTGVNYRWLLESVCASLQAVCFFHLKVTNVLPGQFFVPFNFTWCFRAEQTEHWIDLRSGSTQPLPSTSPTPTTIPQPTNQPNYHPKSTGSFATAPRTCCAALACLVCCLVLPCGDCKRNGTAVSERTEPEHVRTVPSPPV